MFTKIEVITPNRAELYLEKNINNYRKPNKSVVSKYAEDMAAGKWEFNGESIKFSKGGHLIDGQHRLLAIIKSGKPIKMLVIYDVENDVHVFDWNRTRSVSQIATANGIKSANNLVAEAGVLIADGWESARSAKGVILDYLTHNYDELYKAFTISSAGSTGSTSIGRISAISSAIFCLIRIGKNEETLRTFMTVVNSGFPVDGVESSSAILLRNFLLQNSYAKYRVSWRTKTIFSVAVQAYLDFENGTSRRKAYKANFDLADKVRNEAMQRDYERIKSMKEA